MGYAGSSQSLMFLMGYSEIGKPPHIEVPPGGGPIGRFQHKAKGRGSLLAMTDRQGSPKSRLMLNLRMGIQQNDFKH